MFRQPAVAAVLDHDRRVAMYSRGSNLAHDRGRAHDQHEVRKDRGRRVAQDAQELAEVIAVSRRGCGGSKQTLLHVDDIAFLSVSFNLIFSVRVFAVAFLATDTQAALCTTQGETAAHRDRLADGHAGFERIRARFLHFAVD